MLKNFINELKEVSCKPQEYLELLGSLQDKLYKVQENDITEELLSSIDEYINSNDLIIIFDIFSQLKNKEYITLENLNRINKKIVDKYNQILNSDIRYYILGYILQNDLENEQVNNDKVFKEYLENRLEEKKLAKDMLNAIERKNDKSSIAIRFWINSMPNDQNIFKIGELIREDIFENKNMINNLNEIIFQIINEIKNDNENIENILSFIFSIYQDEDFINEYVINKNIKKLNKIMSYQSSKFLNNMFIDIAEKINFNRITNKLEGDITNNYNLFGAAARGDNFTFNDYKILDKYLNKTLKSNKKLAKDFNMNLSYNAQDIIKIADINIDCAINLQDILNRFNIQYYETCFEGNVLGFSFRLKNQNKASIILNKNSKILEARKRFTLAHELGHICSARNEDIISNDNLYNMHVSKLNERDADNFAGELLIPYYGITEVINKDINIKSVENISKKYNISLEVSGIQIIKRSKGAYIFSVYKENKHLYSYKSEEASGLEIKEYIDEFIKAVNDNVSEKFIKNVKVSMIMKNRFKYIIINFVYN